MSSDSPPGTAPGSTGDREPDLVDRVVGAVLAVNGVHDLHAGVLGEVATYLPGRRVSGVRVGEAATETSEVHIVLDWGSPALATADAVREQVERVVPGPVHVVIEDITVPPEPDREPDLDPAHPPTEQKDI